MSVASAVRHPAEALTERRRRSVCSFADLVRLRAYPDRQDFEDALEVFERDQGRLVDSYWDPNGLAGVALTAKSPPPWLRVLGGTSETRFHRSTEAILRNEPEFAQLLLQTDRDMIRASNVLSGMSRRIALFTLFASTRNVLTFLDWYADAKQALENERAAVKGESAQRLRRVIDKKLDELEQDARDTLIVNERILGDWGTYYDQAAARQAQIVYLAGMIGGFVLLIGGAVALGFLFTWLSVPGVDLTTFLGCLIAGGVGAVVSVLMRMNGGKFKVNHEIGREYLSRLGSFRPAIGAVFALVMYFTLRGHLLPNVTPPSPPEGTPSEAFAWYLAVGFLVGFSERLAKEMVSNAERATGLGASPPGGGQDDQAAGAPPPIPSTFTVSRQAATVSRDDGRSGSK